MQPLALTDRIDVLSRIPMVAISKSIIVLILILMSESFADTSSPKQTVRAYIAAHNAWEIQSIRSVREGRELGFESGEIAMEAVERNWELLAAEFFVDLGPDARFSSFGTPVMHPPEIEVIQRQSEKEGRAIIQTKVDRGESSDKFFYLLVKVDDVWKIKDVLSLHEGVSASHVTAVGNECHEKGYFPYKELGFHELVMK